MDLELTFNDHTPVYIKLAVAAFRKCLPSSENSITLMLLEEEMGVEMERYKRALMVLH